MTNLGSRVDNDLGKVKGQGHDGSKPGRKCITGGEGEEGEKEGGLAARFYGWC